MRRKAEAVAPLMAAPCYDYTPQGEMKLVEAPAAVEALRKGFVRLVQAGGQPQVMRLTDEAGRSFPRFDPSTVPDGARPWLGVALDVEGRGTYRIDWIRTFGACPTQERREIERLMLERMAPELGRAGFQEGIQI